MNAFAEQAELEGRGRSDANELRARVSPRFARVANQWRVPAVASYTHPHPFGRSCVPFLRMRSRSRVCVPVGVGVGVGFPVSRSRRTPWPTSRLATHRRPKSATQPNKHLSTTKQKRGTPLAALRVLLVREHGVGLEELFGGRHLLFLAETRTPGA